MLKLVKYLKKYRKNVILGPIFKLTEAVFELIVPLVMAKIIECSKIFIGLIPIHRHGKRFLSRENLVMAELPLW